MNDAMNQIVSALKRTAKPKVHQGRPELQQQPYRVPPSGAGTEMLSRGPYRSPMDGSDREELYQTMPSVPFPGSAPFPEHKVDPSELMSVPFPEQRFDPSDIPSSPMPLMGPGRGLGDLPSPQGFQQPTDSAALRRMMARALAGGR